MFVNQNNIDKHITTIINKAAHSWDMYRVALSSLNAIEHFKYEISSTNFRLKEFKIMLQKCLHYDYEKRPSQEKILKTISSFSLI